MEREKASEAANGGESFMTMLRRLRMANGLTQADLADRLGVVPSTVSFWESGTTIPEPKRIPELAKVLGVSPFELTKYIAPEPQPFAVNGAT